jgi:hypothetical protein
LNNSKPNEIVNLLNSPFCAVLIWETINQYKDEGYDGFPFPLLYLVLPITLHRKTREALPRSRTTKLHSWLQKNPHFKIGFSERTRQTITYTNNALTYGLQKEILIITDEGQVSIGANLIKPIHYSRNANEVYECRKKAQFLGKWFADSGSLTTIFAEWGIKP